MFIRTLIPTLILSSFAAVAAPEPTEPPPAELPASPDAPVRKKAASTKRRTARTPAQLVEAYMPKVKAALAARWAEAVTPRMKEFVPGNLSVSFKLDAEGKVTDVTLTANTTNEPFAKFCDQFLRDTKFEPPPAKALADGQLEIPFTFTIY
jgi:TonB family protein